MAVATILPGNYVADRRSLQDQGVCATYGPLHFRQLAPKDAIRALRETEPDPAQWRWSQAKVVLMQQK